MIGNKKLQVWLPLLFSIVMIIGMFIGYKIGSKGGNRKGFFASNDRNSVQEVLDWIRRRYVDPVNLDSIEGKAIEQMMAGLDPHSVYLPAAKRAEADAELQGEFAGIGVEFEIFNDTVNVLYVLPDGPGDKAGLKVADKIIRADSTLLLNPALTGMARFDSVKKHIRGERGTSLTLQVLRGTQMQTISVKRDLVPVSSIDASYMIDKTTGYIKLNKFSDRSYEEFMKELETLQASGLKALILDLRGNLGGFMNEAVDIADEFLDNDKLIVYTEGAHSERKEYRCKRPGLFEKGKLVVLVNETSASASEVLAGALQDWCRATIVGRRTFGKGLVQEQYPLSDGSAIRLTVARYYTPLGRGIQRSYERGKKVYLDEFEQRLNSSEMLSGDSLRKHNSGKFYITNCNDTLFGSDGISPDIFVAVDTSAVAGYLTRLTEYEWARSFVYKYYLQHRSQIDQYKNAGDFISNVKGQDLASSLLSTTSDTSNLRKMNPQQLEYFGTRLKAMLAKYRWRTNGVFQVLNTYDNAVLSALAEIRK